MNNMNAGSQHKDHLVVVSHGVWGVPAHVGELEMRLRRDGYSVLNISQNSRWKTTSGIELCGQRFYVEVKAKLRERPYSRISFIGYSFGGILARYVAGLLEADGVFDTIEPIHFITIATPHLGIRRPSRNLMGQIENRILDYAGPIICGETLRELTFRDAEVLDDCFLVQLASPKQKFLKALGHFRNRITVANVRNDRTVFYSTASLSAFNPHKTHSDVLEKVVHLVEQDPPFVVGVTPHRLASKHLEEYSALISHRKDSITDTLPQQSGWNALKVTMAKYSRIVGLCFLVPFVACTVFPFATINRFLQTRRDANELVLYDVKRRNAQCNRAKCRSNGVDEQQPWKQIRTWIDKHAPFTKVDVFLGGTNTHGAIIARPDSLNKHEGSHVLQFIVEHCMRKYSYE